MIVVRYTANSFSFRAALIVAALLAGVLATSSLIIGQTPPKYEMLVMGDSVMWGQGLEDGQKFTTLVRKELENRLGRPVNIVNTSHSGANIRPIDRTKLIQHGEVPLHTPTLWQQLDIAIANYKCEELKGARGPGSRPKYRCKDVGLVLLDGGINDVGITKLMSPFTFERSIKNGSHKYCDLAMKEFLDEVLATFDNATVVVTGYFPVFCAGEGGTDPYFIRKLIKSYAGRGIRGEEKAEKPNPKAHDWFVDRLSALSTLWKKVSDADLTAAVDRANQTAGTRRALFVKIDFKPTECYAASDTNLWRLKGFDANREPITDDHLLSVRTQTLCPNAKKEMNAVDMAFFSRMFLIALCKPAGAGHPNEKGARKYADAILAELGKTFLANRGVPL